VYINIKFGKKYIILRGSLLAFTILSHPAVYVKGYSQQLQMLQNETTTVKTLIVQLTPDNSLHKIHL
jgi:hypothetical protein